VAEDLSAEGSGDLLMKDKAELFHKIVAKGLFLCKRARPDIHPTIAVLCTRVRTPNQDDWRKMVRLIRYLNGTHQEDMLYLSALMTCTWFAGTLMQHLLCIPTSGATLAAS
jgi:hypothetical protein